MGDTIEEFASENATVVVGTVIDPDMGDELKVTVVATGLGSFSAVVQDAPFKVVESERSRKSNPLQLPIGTWIVRR